MASWTSAGERRAVSRARRGVPAWHHGLALAAIVAAYGLVATRHMDLPGIYADSINPDYLVNRVLNPDAARSIVWVLFGNSLLGDRAPVLISLYHGSQQFWLGLPLYAIFGTSVEGVRLVHATFALGVLLSMYLLLQRAATPWLAALACIALAIDPAFSYSFRTQAYITVAPAAWIFLALWCLQRTEGVSDASARRLLLASGVFCGLATVGYFVWAFVLVPIAVMAARCGPSPSLARPGWRRWAGGVAIGAAAYPVGYLLVARKAGSFEGLLAFLREQQQVIAPFRSELTLGERATHAGAALRSVIDGSWHSAMMFNGESLTVPGATLKLAVVALLPLLLWVIAEITRTATALQRTLVALPVSFVAGALVFGDRLGGHHYCVVVPLLYAALGVGLGTVALPRRAWIAGVGVGILVTLMGLNVSAQARFDARLVATGGRGLLSDAIHRLAADLDATHPKPLLWFPDAVLALPLIMLTHGEVEMSDQLEDPVPRRRLCAGEDVWMVRIPDHASAARGDLWRSRLQWPTAPEVRVYADRGGSVVFEVLRFAGKGGACQNR